MLMAGIGTSIHYFAFTGQWRKAIASENTLFFTHPVLYHYLHCSAVDAGARYLQTRPRRICISGYIHHHHNRMTTNYQQWPAFLWAFIFLLMFTGACSGSTGGGVKMVRILLLLKNSTHELKRLVHPQAIIPVRLNGKFVGEETIFNVLAFFLIYIMVFATNGFIVYRS